VPEPVKDCTLTPVPAGAALVHADPLDVSTLPVVPGATAGTATPLTVNDVPPMATLPDASFTMLFVLPDG
jgi:hypothetical protein